MRNVIRGKAALVVLAALAIGASAAWASQGGDDPPGDDSATQGVGELVTAISAVDDSPGDRRRQRGRDRGRGENHGHHSSHPEPGDDHGGRGKSEPWDDHGGRGEDEPWDDHGGDDDVELGDDHGGHGSDDGPWED